MVLRGRLLLLVGLFGRGVYSCVVVLVGVVGVVVRMWFRRCFGLLGGGLLGGEYLCLHLFLSCLSFCSWTVVVFS